jgi:hypothetical protein
MIQKACGRQQSWHIALVFSCRDSKKKLQTINKKINKG